MNMCLDCIPCFVRQAADAVKMSATSEEEQNRLMRSVLSWLGDIDLNQTPPAASQMIHRRLRELLPSDDPYRAAKDRHNELAAALIPSIRKRIAGSFDPLVMAVRYAITGNIIDLGAKNSVGAGEIYGELQSAPMQPIFGELEYLKKSLRQAKTILYLADNAGEIFFDRLLIEQLTQATVTLAVRGMPVINDATRIDAQAAGLEDISEIIDNGSDAPGTILADCSADFRRRFDEADLIIAKGQGNYESLSDTARGIFFLFRTKCPVISRHSGFSVGTFVASNRSSKPSFAAPGEVQ
ncbi:MAG: ARMT1-like domain-containing protein [Smithellaceae bacterium]